MKIRKTLIFNAWIIGTKKEMKFISQRINKHKGQKTLFKVIIIKEEL